MVPNKQYNTIADAVLYSQQTYMMFEIKKAMSMTNGSISSHCDI